MCIMHRAYRFHDIYYLYGVWDDRPCLNEGTNLKALQAVWLACPSTLSPFHPSVHFTLQSTSPFSPLHSSVHFILQSTSPFSPLHSSVHFTLQSTSPFSPLHPYFTLQSTSPFSPLHPSVHFIPPFSPLHPSVHFIPQSTSLHPSVHFTLQSTSSFSPLHPSVHFTPQSTSPLSPVPVVGSEIKGLSADNLWDGQLVFLLQVRLGRNVRLRAWSTNKDTAYRQGFCLLTRILPFWFLSVRFI